MTSMAWERIESPGRSVARATSLFDYPAQPSRPVAAQPPGRGAEERDRWRLPSTRRGPGQQQLSTTSTTPALTAARTSRPSGLPQRSSLSGAYRPVSARRSSAMATSIARLASNIALSWKDLLDGGHRSPRQPPRSPLPWSRHIRGRRISGRCSRIRCRVRACCPAASRRYGRAGYRRLARCSDPIFAINYRHTQSTAEDGRTARAPRDPGVQNTEQGSAVTATQSERASVSVMLIVPDASAAVSWYKTALGAAELWNLGGVAGLHLRGAPFMLHEAVPGRKTEPSPIEVGLTTTRIEVFVDDPASSSSRQPKPAPPRFNPSPAMRPRGERISRAASLIRSGIDGQSGTEHRSSLTLHNHPFRTARKPNTERTLGAAHPARPTPPRRRRSAALLP